MARIELSFYDKNYVIEYNRASVKELVLLSKDKNEFDQAVALIKSGLVMHHKDDMPSDDIITGWLMAMTGNENDLSEFVNTLHEMVQDVLDTFKEDRKNLKWGKVEA